MEGQNTTSSNEDNPVKLRITKKNNNPDSAIVGYQYVTKNKKTDQFLGNNGSADFIINIKDLQDPGARITLYGSGKGQIISENVVYIDPHLGVGFTASYTFESDQLIFGNTFNYPNNNITVKVTCDYKKYGNTDRLPYLDAPSNWTHIWLVDFGGITAGTSISGNGNSGSGTFSFSCPYNTNWTNSEQPTVKVFCSYIEAAYHNLPIGGYFVDQNYFKIVNKLGQYDGVTGELLDENYETLDGAALVRSGEYPIIEETDWAVIIPYVVEVWEGDTYIGKSTYARVSLDNGSKFLKRVHVGGTEESGTIRWTHN